MAVSLRCSQLLALGWLCVALLAVLSASPASAQTWQSKWVKQQSTGKMSYLPDDAGNRIPDFSFAGYKQSSVTLPNVPTVVNFAWRSGDCSAALNTAIAKMADLPVQADGFRGALQFAAGSYQLGSQVLVQVPGVVLRGVGSGTDATKNTILKSTSKTLDDVLLFKGFSSKFAGGRSGAKVPITDAVVALGSRRMNILPADASNFAVGQWVVIVYPLTAAWYKSVNYGDPATSEKWGVGMLPDITFVRQITKINNGVIDVDVPVYQKLDASLSRAYLQRIDTGDKYFLHNVGVENLLIDIGFDKNLRDGVDYIDEAHADSAVTFQATFDAFARNVVAKHFAHAGFKFASAMQGTVSGCQAINPVSVVTGGQRYNFVVDSGGAQQILFDGCVASDGRHAFVSNGMTLVSGVVFRNGKSINARTSSEAHMKWTMGLLYETTSFSASNLLTGKAPRVVALYNRGDMGSSHGWSAANSVLWNLQLATLDGRTAGACVQRPPNAQNWAIGVSGGAVTEHGLWCPFKNLDYGAAAYDNPTTTDTLQPASLFAAQYFARTGKNMPVLSQSARAEEPGELDPIAGPDELPDASQDQLNTIPDGASDPGNTDASSDSGSSSGGFASNKLHLGLLIGGIVLGLVAIVALVFLLRCVRARAQTKRDMHSMGTQMTSNPATISNVV